MKKNILRYDGPVFEFIGKLVDLMKLNFFMIIFSLPIITIGTTITAAHYSGLKIRRGESYVWKNFWKSFKQNFGQSTLVWIMVLSWVVLTVCTWNILVASDGIFVLILQGMVIAITFLVIFLLLWVFPVQAKFVNRIPMLFLNAFRICTKNIGKTLYMLMVHLLPILLLIASEKMQIVVLLYGLSIPVYLSVGIYDSMFRDLEAVIIERGDCDEM